MDEEVVPIADGFAPPPWDVYEHPEKTEGWIAYQEELRIRKRTATMRRFKLDEEPVIYG